MDSYFLSNCALSVNGAYKCRRPLVRIVGLSLERRMSAYVLQYQLFVEPHEARWHMQTTISTCSLRPVMH